MACVEEYLHTVWNSETGNWQKVEGGCSFVSGCFFVTSLSLITLFTT